MKLIVILSLITALLLQKSSGFRCRALKNHFCPSYLSQNNEPSASSAASSNLIKKAKMKSIATLLKEIELKGDEHYVNQYLKNNIRPYGLIKPTNFYQSTKTDVGTVTLLIEYNKKEKTGFMIGMPPPEIMGGVLRDAGAKAIIVSLDARVGGATPDEFYRFGKEQAKARIVLPGPLPIVWNDYIIDNIQIDQAAALGGAGVVLYPDVLNSLSETITYAKKRGLEAIVMVKSFQDAENALAAGARCICMYNLLEPELLKLRKLLPSKTTDGDDILYSAKLLPEVDFSTYNEIDLAWVLRDSGFASVWPSVAAIYPTGMSDIYANINAMRSKASRHFLSPRQYLMDRKREGAKEYLGDILY